MIQAITFNILASAVFLGVFKALFARLTFFQVNRFLILFAVGLISIGTLIPEVFLVSSNLRSYVPVELPELVFSSTSNGIESAIGSWWQGLIGIYIIGVSISLARLMVGLFKVFTLVRSSRPENRLGRKVFVTDEVESPFSFMHWIVIPRRLSSNSVQHVIQHELVHVQQWHSLERMLMELLCSVFWFNPFFWKLKSELIKTHEFIADKVVADSDFSHDYENSILQLAISGAVFSTSNTFSNPSLTKTRIDMMNKQRTRSRSVLLYSLIIPLFASFMVFSGADINTANAQTKKESKEVDVMPEFPGGQKALIQYMIDQIKYPEDAEKAGVEGKVIVGFNVDKTGAITEVRIKKGVHPSLDKQAVSVVAGMPNWNPGMDQGKPVNVELVLPISYKLEDAKEGAKSPSKG